MHGVERLYKNIDVIKHNVLLIVLQNYLYIGGLLNTITAAIVIVQRLLTETGGWIHYTPRGDKN